VVSKSVCVHFRAVTSCSSTHAGCQPAGPPPVPSFRCACMAGISARVGWVRGGGQHVCLQAYKYVYMHMNLRRWVGARARYLSILTSLTPAISPRLFSRLGLPPHGHPNKRYEHGSCGVRVCVHANVSACVTIHVCAYAYGVHRCM